MTWNETEEEMISIADSEMEELENDEINASEAGFMRGYEEE